MFAACRLPACHSLSVKVRECRLVTQFARVTFCRASANREIAISSISFYLSSEVSGKILPRRNIVRALDRDTKETKKEREREREREREKREEREREGAEDQARAFPRERAQRTRTRINFHGLTLLWRNLKRRDNVLTLHASRDPQRAEYG